MIKLLSSIVNTISSIVSFIVSSIQAFTNILLNIPNYLTFISTSIGFMPTIFIGFLLATISIYVVFFIIDR